ncbi:MAG TPA: dNTP triphosphohydrolase, partial [Planctomycetota bacterium]|nr:dNTP triphosphohydrolase [Planctomycetota bacterium]
HSAAFRRLQHKTQVLAAFEGDHYRSRMTHSLEVSQMARSVTSALLLNSDLAEAIALAHDLGHPPFGHAGEQALDEVMQDHGGFRHNAQGARIVDLLEDRYGHGHGLNLTLLTRCSLLKGKVPDGFPLSADLLPKQVAPLEAHVVDLCDKIAYLSHDLDDGLRAGLFAEQQAGMLRLWQMARARTGDGTRLRVISEVTSLLIHDLVEATDAILTASLPVTMTTPPPRITHGPSMAVMAHELLEFLRTHFYRSAHVLAVMQDGATRIRTLFHGLVADPERLSGSHRARIDHDGLQRVVCDYIAGMTDRYLLQLT